MVCFHGTTDKATYELIMQEGVRKGSYWTTELQTALMMGGPYVIGVFFSKITEKWIGEGKWQFISKKTIKPKDFIITMKYSAKMLTFNAEADRKMRKFFSKADGKKWCNYCDNFEETTYLNNGHGWLIGGSRFDDKVCKVKNRNGVFSPCLKCCGRVRS